MFKFGHFGLKIGPLRFWNLTKNPWDYETRAQELTSGAIHTFLSLLVLIWESFKDGAWEGFFAAWNLGVIWTFFTFFTIPQLWIDQSLKNWWPNWRVFDALTDSGKIFEQYGLKKILFTLKAGEKSQILMSFSLFFIEKLCHFQTENWLKIHEQIKLQLKS